MGSLRNCNFLVLKKVGLNGEIRAGDRIRIIHLKGEDSTHDCKENR